MSTLDFGSFGEVPGFGAGRRNGAPKVDETHWGYTIHEHARNKGAQFMWAPFARFSGIVLLFIAAALLLLPSPASIADTPLKAVAAVMFALFGVVLSRTAPSEDHPEIQVDTNRGELRVGKRGFRGTFRQRAGLTFTDVTSVYLLRSKEHGRPARLFLRLGDHGDALEVASGPEESLDALRDRLATDLKGNLRAVLRKDHQFVTKEMCAA